MTRRRKTRNCQLNGHVLGAGRRCAACGKPAPRGPRSNPPEKTFLITSTGPDAQRIYFSDTGRWVRDRQRAKRYTKKYAVELAGLLAEHSPGVRPIELLKPGFIRSTNRPPNLEEATAMRMAEFVDGAESGITEMTGKLRREYVPADPMERGGDVVGRFGGLKKSYPELLAIGAGPKQIAQAIRRGKGRTFETVKQLMEGQLSKLGFKPARRRSPAKATVAPHPRLTARCKHCAGLHTTSQHRFHGAGSLHRTHLWAFNPPAPAIKPQRIGRTQRVFYLRDQGNLQGPYVHKFTRRAAGLWTHAPGWYYFDKNVAVIR